MLSSSFKLLAPVYALSLGSLIMLGSISSTLFFTQLIWLAIGTALIVALVYIDIRSLLRSRSFILLLYFISS